MQTDLARAVREALVAQGTPVEKLAATLGVAPSTVTRWKNGSVEPHITTAKRILKILGAENEQPNEISIISATPPSKETIRIVEFRRRFSDTLRALRETIHRSGNISSRNEALSELTKLLFAHVMVATHHGNGLLSIQNSEHPARDLKALVRQAYKDYLPPSLAQDMEAHDFELHMRAGADEYAKELTRCFEPISSEEIVAMFKGEDGVDALNDAFALFLSQAFHDEKELGQYLTPPNVVSFMTQLALSSLSESEYAVLTDPDRCTEFGVILDPSCGTASFLSEVVRTLYPDVRVRHDPEAAKRWLRKMTANVLVGVDKSDRMLALALTNLALLGAETVHLKSANALRGKTLEVNGLGDITGQVGIILTNPPFGAEFFGNDLSAYRIFSEWAERRPKSINSELLFMERYLDWLRPNGVVSVIVPDSILYNKGLFADLRRALGRYFEVVSSISLPPVTFASAGTSTKTSVLTLRKRDSAEAATRSTYFAVCTDVGYAVSSRGAQRSIVPSGEDQLPSILREATRQCDEKIGKSAHLDAKASRWDANFNKGLPDWVQRKIGTRKHELLRLGDVAHLVTRRGDPRRLGADSFNYIEISNVDIESGRVTSKEVATADAPSRARKVVAAKDILFSTVRPERRCVGVVPEGLDGAFCSTGFAVLEVREVELDPLVIRQLLCSDFVTLQVLQHNVGISYPAIDESCLEEIVLPCDISELANVSKLGETVSLLTADLLRAQSELKSAVDEMMG